MKSEAVSLAVDKIWSAASSSESNILMDTLAVLFSTGFVVIKESPDVLLIA